MSLLTIVQSAALRTLASKPTVAAASTDPKILQLVEYVNEDGQELAARHSWQALRKEAALSTPGTLGGILSFKSLVGGSGYANGFSNTYNLVPLTGGTGTGAQATIAVVNGVVQSVTIYISAQGSGYVAGDVVSASNANLGGTGSGFQITVATVGIVGLQAQGDIRTITGPDFAFIVNETMWNRTQRRPVFGPKSPAEWQQLQAQFLQGPWIQYILRGYQLLFLPAPSPGFAVYFEWCSKFWASGSGGGGGPPPWSSVLSESFVTTLNQTVFTFSGIPAAAPVVFVSLDGSTIYPGTDYTLTSSGLTLTSGALAGQTLVVYFASLTPASLPSSGSGQSSLILDTDTSLLDERLHILGAMWRFKKANRMEYSEDFDNYEKAVADAITRDGSKGRLNLAGAQTDIYPGVVVPAGNWPMTGVPNG